jgi:hypothetical protein
VPLDHAVVVRIAPESDELCGNCPLLYGINVATCRANFGPVFSGRVTLRPQACRDAAATVELTRLHVGVWSNLP